MDLFFRRKSPDFLTTAEKAEVIEAIQQAEQRTSGEVRVFIESRCRYVDALDRAREIFDGLEMEKTDMRNATLVYVAVKDHQAAVFGDSGIHEKVGNEYWNKEVTQMLQLFRNHKLAEGLKHCIKDIGEALHYYFPFERNTDKNELPDEIVFGR